MIFAYIAARMAKFFFRFLLLVSVLLIDGLDQLQGSANDSLTRYNSAQLLQNALCHSVEEEPPTNTSLDLDGEAYFHNIDLIEISEEKIEYGSSVFKKKSAAGDYAKSIHCWQARNYLASYRKHILRRFKDFCHIASRRHLFLSILRN
jgi:hypothetical protein